MNFSISKNQAWRRVQADINEMPHEFAAWAMRRCAAEGVGSLRLLKALSHRAFVTAPEEHRYLYRKWAKVYAEGRRVKVIITGVPEPDSDQDPYLIDVINEAISRETGST